ncbi:hypothetical protein AURDEDRAFT_115099 [Auricularia subglabra TFB-10046 SS5]|nr:hypothetical protein AURDEDRAFT_115099 [Auricularia subglabra TFB-10046 SS5]
MDAQSLGKLFEHMPNIRTLRVKTQPLSMDGTSATFSLTNSTLRELNLYSQDLDADVMRRISFPALRHTELHVDAGPLFPEVVTAMIQSTMPGVRHLALSADVGSGLLPGLRALSHIRRL